MWAVALALVVLLAATPLPTVASAEGESEVQVGEHGYHYSIGSAFAGKGGFLGVQLTDLTPELRAHFGVATDEGVMVAKVVDDSPAFLAGLAAGDIITRVEGETVKSSSDLTHMIRSREEGETVTLEIWREGAAETLSATLDKSERVAGHRRHIMIDCSEDDEDCEGMLMAHIHHETAIDCPDGEDCEVKIDCDDGDCDCTLNGETLDCEKLLMEYDPPD
jgi:membrane-associated protease RseP (regulator of RpoE activity)